MKNDVFPIFGFEVSIKHPIAWHHDPISKYTWQKNQPSHAFSFIDSPKADVKIVWELSRCQFFPCLALLYRKTQDEAIREKLLAIWMSWIEENPLNFGVHWVTPMEVAIRAINWIAAFEILSETDALGEPLARRISESLAEHATFIYWNLEFGKVTGNHYLANGTGLIWLGLFLGRATYVRKGKAILEESMRVQIYQDGVDYEKSLPYHKLVLELFQLGVALGMKNGLQFSAEFEKKLEQMKRFWDAAKKPNGKTPNVGDDDSGYVLVLSDSFLNPSRKQTGSRIFRDGGFAVLRHAEIHLFFDFGDIGMNGWGGHGHNDSLSFELFANGKNLIVDSGTYNYTLFQAERQRLRSIASHNTIQIDGKELVPFRNLWSIQADTTQPKLHEWSFDENRDCIEASVQNNGVRHRRRIVLDKKANRLYLTDVLSGDGRHEAMFRLHFAPDLMPTLQNQTLQLGEISLHCEGFSNMNIADSIYSKGYYQKEANKKLEASFVFETEWQGQIIFQFS
ncbi:alginate lyase family protein [Chloroherpeton thalassium]|uniref:alginate lyase family protein n=1 Tax=Chloroherpeton thalassium TaxID=100716 RepID=UPI000308992F|nr:alginate lyase family protein [Chloroherpeton thalassium]